MTTPDQAIEDARQPTRPPIELLGLAARALGEAHLTLMALSGQVAGDEQSRLREAALRVARYETGALGVLADLIGTAGDVAPLDASLARSAFEAQGERREA